MARSERDVTRRGRDIAIRLPRSTMVIIRILALVVVALAVLIGIAAIASANAPRAAASAAELQLQQVAAERDVERAYEQAVDQVAKVRALNLAISAAQADLIANKAVADLKTLRHSAFVALGQQHGLSGADADAYAVSLEARFTSAPVAKQPSPTPVLLAPRYYSIVSRMSELSSQLSEQATTQLTAPASQAPQPSPSPSPSGSARPSPTPSPTR
jgi:hypothetical protein